MIKSFLLFFFAILSFQGYTQNTFPPTGNVGIGTTSPVAALGFTDVDVTTSPIGITWYGGGGTTYSTLYGIHRTSGTWSAPDYQQLRLGWETGIVLDPGTAYGKSYVEIKGNGLRIPNGNVGIGTTNPVYTLDIAKGPGGSSAYVGLSSVDYNTQLILGATSLGNNIYSQTIAGAAAAFNIYQANTNVFNINSSGNVGIGISNPQAKLDVNGNIFSNGKIAIGTTDMAKISTYSLAVNGDAIFNRVKVKLYNTWPDYVFEKDYKLPTLVEVEKYIQQNKHLLDIPSAKEVEENGLDLGDNQALLLKKIEELTLYIIDLNKRLEAQDKKIKTLQEQQSNNK